jgi:hypothetical protein
MEVVSGDPDTVDGTIHAPGYVEGIGGYAKVPPVSLTRRFHVYELD